MKIFQPKNTKFNFTSLTFLLIFLTQFSLTLKCEENCKSCVNDIQRTSSTKCTECKDGFFLFSEYCHPCISHCKKCSLSKKCIICNNFRFFKEGRCQISLGSILIHITAVCIIVISIWLLITNWKKLQDIQGEIEVEAEIQKMDKDLNKNTLDNTLDDSTLTNKTGVDTSGLDYMEDVDDEGNVKRKNSGVVVKI